MRFAQRTFNTLFEKHAFNHPLKSIKFTYYNPCIKLVCLEMYVKCTFWLKLFCGYKYTRPCIESNQLYLQVNGHAWFHLHGLRWPGGSEKFKMEISISSGIRTNATPLHDRKVSAVTARPHWFDIKCSIYSLTVFWFMNTNAYVTIPVLNRLWFETQYKVLYTC